ncbi:hypothetical protein IHN57_09460, partial [Deinococcus sp. 6GRE01]|nr:hypothetical protein [Deinococcus sp. 6GRE01]
GPLQSLFERPAAGGLNCTAPTPRPSVQFERYVRDGRPDDGARETL